jgi:sulfur-oxidizing protein SoxZ
MGADEMSAIGEARIKVPDQIRPGDLITVNSIISHPMDTGFFRTAEGAPIPAYFIKDVVVTYGDAEVARFEWTSGISRNPVVSFTLKVDKEASLTMVWSDNKGATFKQSTNISFASA